MTDAIDDDDITFVLTLEDDNCENQEEISRGSSIISSMVSSNDPDDDEEEDDDSTDPDASYAGNSDDEINFTEVPLPGSDPCEQEIYNFLERHGATNLPFNVDLDTIYRVVCARPMCDKMLAFMIKKAEEKFLQDPVIAEIAAFGQYSDTFDWQKEWSGQFTAVSAMRVVEVFKDFQAPVWYDDPISVAAFATMVGLTVNEHYPEQMIFQGAKYYVRTNSDAHKQFKMLVGSASTPQDLANFWKDMKDKFCFSENEEQQQEEAESILELVRSVMKKGYGWIRFGEIGYIIPNDVINFYTLDLLPFPFNNFQRYQIAQFVGNLLYGSAKEFAVFKNFTILQYDFHPKMHRYFETCNNQRKKVINECLGDRMTTLGSEMVSEEILKEFEEVDDEREAIKKNLDGIMKWIAQFNEAVNLNAQ